MLDMSSSHSKSGNPATATSNGGKRIPASLMKMRRESLAASGKYKLDLGGAQGAAVPKTSLISMTGITKSKSFVGSGEPAYCTPKSLTSKSLTASFDQAAGYLGKSDFKSDETPLSSVFSLSLSNHGNNKSNIRRSQSSNGMELLVQSGLVTPKRTTGRSIGLPPAVTSTSVDLGTTSSHSMQQRLSRLKNKTDSLAGGSAHATAETPSSSSAPKTPRRTGHTPRRSKSADDTAEVLSTPRRASRKPNVAATTPRRHPGDKNCPPNEEDGTASLSDLSEHTAQAPKTWTCSCGEVTPATCRYCGMCGSPERWDCSGCSFANKCKFRFCGMCGIPKAVKAS